MTTTTATDPLTAWVEADRDTEHDAWERLYEALHPRPAAPMSGAAGRVTGLMRPRRVFRDAA